MKFLHLFNKSPSAYDDFTKIQGYEDIKDIVRRVLESDENYNLLFVGPSASSKTLFLQGILEMKSGVYFEILEFWMCYRKGDPKLSVSTSWIKCRASSRTNY